MELDWCWPSWLVFLAIFSYSSVVNLLVIFVFMGRFGYVVLVWNGLTDSYAVYDNNSSRFFGRD